MFIWHVHCSGANVELPRNILQVMLGFSREKQFVYSSDTSTTELEVTRNTAPRGINKIAIMKNVGKTDFAVKIGCQAGNLCCLNAVLSGFFDSGTFVSAPSVTS